MSEIRNRRIDIRVSEEELQKILAKMARISISSLSEYIRRMAIRGYIINLDLSPVKEAVTQLRRIGNGINQIAKVANSTGIVYAEDIEKIKKAQDESWKIMNQILEKLSAIT